MADNIELSQGSGGATLRTLETAAGIEYPVSALAYATTISPGANVLQEVTAASPLPVSATLVGTLVVDAVVAPVAVVNADPDDLKATVTLVSGSTLAATQSGSWTVAATQSGTWNIGTVTAVTSITNPVAVTQSGTWTFGLSAAQTLANVTTVGTITNAVTVSQGTAANLKATVDINSGQTLSTVTTVGAVTSITNPVTVAQSNAANLLATVSIAAAQTLATVTNVGTVTTVTSITNPVAVTQSGTWNAGINAGTNLIGKASVGLDTATIYDGTTALTPKFAVIDASSSGNTQIVAAVSGKHIRVLRWSLTSLGTTNAALRSGTTTKISGTKYLIASAAAGGAYTPPGICQTAVNEALNINLSASVAVSGELTYVEVS